MNYKNKANVTLLCVFLVFLVTIFLKYLYGNSPVFNFFFMVMEASLVGGIADWFAITAMFSKPLGIAYHTELIPRNREKIIAGISNMVEKELLNKDIISKKILQLKIIDKLIVFINDKKAYIIEKSEKYIYSYLAEHDREKFIDMYHDIIKNYIDKFDITDNIKLFSEKIKNTEKEEKIIDFIIDGAIYFTEKENIKYFIYTKLVDLKERKLNNFLSRISFSIFEKTDSVNFLSAASSIQNGIIDSLINMKKRDNDMRNILKEEIREYISSIEYHREEVERFKKNFFYELDVCSLLSNIIDNKSKKKSILSGCIRFYIESILEIFNNNDNLKKCVENIIKEVINSFAEKEHKFIGSIVTETLNEFDNNKLNSFIENKFGNDLQWIRINGSLIGGIIGALMFMFLNFIYDPYVVPILRSILGTFK